MSSQLENIFDYHFATLQVLDKRLSNFAGLQHTRWARHS